MAYVPVSTHSHQLTPEQAEAVRVAAVEKHGEPDPLASDAAKPIAMAVLASLAAIAAIAALVLALLPGTLRGQGTQGADRSALIVLRGNDTLVVERLTRTAGGIQGDVAMRGVGRLTYVAEVVNGPATPLLSFQVYGDNAAPDAPARQSGAIRITADSAILGGQAGGQPFRFATPVSGWPLPLINNDFAMTELLIGRARRSGRPSYSEKMFLLVGRGSLVDVTVTRSGADSVVVSIGGQDQRFAIDSAGRISGGTIPGAGLSVVRVVGDAAARVAFGRIDYGAPPGAPYTAEEVTVPARGGHTLSGTLTIPRGAAGRVPAVVTITGSGQQDRDEFLVIVPGYRPFRQLADTLGRRGIAVLRLDDRGINGSGGNVSNATSADFADDIRAAVAFLRARSEIDPDRIALYGHSEGGLIAPMVAATDGKLAGIVLAAGPAYTGRKIIDFQLRNLVMGNPAIPAAARDSAVKANFAQWDSTSGKTPWVKFFLDHDPIATLKRVKVPVLIAQGGTDQQVTPEQAAIIERTLRESGNRNVTMRVFADRNHLFLDDPVGFPGDYAKLTNPRVSSDVMGPVAEWLVTTLRAQPIRP